jgi:hypothetical protein
MREAVSAANVGLSSRRRVKRKDDSARKNGAPPEWEGRKRCRFLLGRKTAVVRWWARIQASGGREVSQQKVEHRWKGRARTEEWCRRRRLRVREG